MSSIAKMEQQRRRDFDGIRAKVLGHPLALSFYSRGVPRALNARVTYFAAEKGQQF
jgi:hypothetical protein